MRSSRTSTSAFETIIVRLPAPYDLETLDRMIDVRALLSGG